MVNCNATNQKLMTGVVTVQKLWSDRKGYKIMPRYRLRHSHQVFSGMP